MRRTKAHEIVDTLADLGIRHVFGIPGTHNIEFYDALMDNPRLTGVLITDEQSAGFMADGYARASGRTAALCLVPGAGLTHAMSGIAEAYLDQVPLLVLACGIRGDSGKKYQLHDIDQMAMVRPVCKWATTIHDWTRVDEVLRAAYRIANEAPHGPVVVELPAEGLLLANPRSTVQGAIPEPVCFNEISEAQRAQVRRLIADSRQIGLYIGNIGKDVETSRQLVKLAEHLNAWVWTTISAKGLFPETHPRFVWNVLGEGAPAELQNLERKVNLWIALGAKFGEVATAGYGFATDQPLIHIDVDPAVLGANQKETLSLQMNAHDFIGFLLNEIGEAPDRTDSAVVNAKRELAARAVRAPEKPGKISPRRLFRALQDVFPENTVYGVDSGNGLFQAMENLELAGPGCFLAPTDFSCMGYSVPAAIGAKIAEPRRHVVVLPGDGAFLMTGLELLTANMMGCSPLVLVLRDGGLSQIAQFQRGSVVRTHMTDLPAMDLSGIAKAVGFSYEFLESTTDLEAFCSSLKARSEQGEGVLVEVPIDYSVSTAFTQGVIQSNFKRFPLQDKLSLVGRVLARRTAEHF